LGKQKTQILYQKKVEDMSKKRTSPRARRWSQIDQISREEGYFAKRRGLARTRRRRKSGMSKPTGGGAQPRASARRKSSKV